MNIIYVGDAKNLNKRIRQHCGGNVESSALRQHIASKKGYSLRKTKRPNGSIRKRLDLHDPKVGEQSISDYLKTGIWKVVVCKSAIEANDFQWYMIKELHPDLNVTRKQWQPENTARYMELLREFNDSSDFRCNDVKHVTSASGVYVFFHTDLPDGYVEQAVRP